MAGGAPGGLALMSCVREASLEPPYDAPQPDRNGADTTRKGRFLRGLRRMFRRRGAAEDRATSAISAVAAAELKSRSTGELLHDGHHERTHIRKESSSGSGGGCGGGAYASGLSVSHDSVFTGERSGASGASGTSGGDSGDERTQRPRRHHHHHLTTGVRAELFDAVRRRGRDTSDDDEDLGLPRSPPASPPVKHHQRHHAGISQSSCSDGSLLSVGSSEPDEDSSGVQLDSYVVSEPPSGVAPLSHAAARHKMAVRPRRTHGAPRRNRKNVTVAAVGVSVGSLPITPELNEESAAGAAAGTRQLITETFSTRTVKHVTTSKDAQTQLITNELTQMLECAENKARIKSASLPPGLQLSQLSTTPAKLTLAHNRDNSTQSSIKRSKSSTQGKTADLAQTDIQSSQYVDSSKYYSEHSVSQNKYTYKSNSNEIQPNYKKETLEKAEKKIILEKREIDKTKTQESETKNSTKREESFFTRLLLRKSGKKTKKETPSESENQSERKTSQNKLATSHYKSLNVEPQSKTTFAEHAYVRQQKMMCSDQNAHTAGQKVFANQAHKRIDNKGLYVNDTLLKENVNNFSKDSVMDYGTNDLKYVTDTDKTGDVMNKCLKNDDAYKRSNIDVVRVREQVDNRKSQDWNQKSISKVPGSNIIIESGKEKNVYNLKQSDEYMFTPTPSPRYKLAHQQEFTYNGGSMPKVIPYSSHEIQISCSASPPRSIWPQMDSNIQHRSTSLAFPVIPEQIKLGTDQVAVELESKELNISRSSSELDTESNFYATDVSMGEARNLISKSHSFRFPSESVSHSEENPMPSLPTVVGISEHLMENWEINYRKNLGKDSDRYLNPGNDNSKRLSARNYDVFTPGINENFSSLPNTENSYLDSLKTIKQEKAEPKSIYINSSSEPEREDISQIEAKIDDIIGSPKVLIAPVLKSSSLDSVKSYTDKHVMEERRKTISTDNILSSNVHVTANMVGSVSFHSYQPDGDFKNQSRFSDGFENHVTVTHIKRESLADEKVVYENLETLKKMSRSVEKLTDKFDPSVPEFLKIQLNKVDSKPKTNVVLTANATPRRTENANVNVCSKRDMNLDESYILEQSSDLFDYNSSPIVTVATRDSDERLDTRERFSFNNVQLRKTGSQQLLNRSMEQLCQDTVSNLDNLPKIFPENKVTSHGQSNSVDIKKFATNATTNYTLPPLSPTAQKPFYKKKSISIEICDSKTDSLKCIPTGIETQNERVYENVTIEQKTYSSFGSRTSLQSSDSNEMKSPERSDSETVVFRKKPVIVAKEQRTGRKKEDEPELMKVFARRSLKLKDSEAETLAQEIMEAHATKEEIIDEILSNKSKLIKNELNSSIKSRDSDKENESGSPKDENRRRTFDNDYNHIVKSNNIGNLKMNEKLDFQRAAKKYIDNSSSINNNGVTLNRTHGMNFGQPYYQRSVSVSSVSNNNTNGEKEKTANKNEVNKYKKEISDSTPEKRLRNRTFPDSSNDRDEIKTIGAKNAAIFSKNDSASLPKKPWSQFKQDDNGNKRGFRNTSFGFSESQKEKLMHLSPDTEKMVSDAAEQESSGDAMSDSLAGRDTDASPQFKGMLHMRAEWERRAKQAMTK